MADISPIKSEFELQAFNTDLLEDASADLQVVSTFIDMCENLLIDLRMLFEACGRDPKTHREFLNLDIMLYEANQRSEGARDKIIDTVHAYLAARKAAKVA